ncbi:MAG: hypothetical protein ACR2PA_05600 [Hyphomicrobiaceae bacterium]
MPGRMWLKLRMSFLVLVWVNGLLLVRPATAEPVLDRVLSDVEVLAKPRCTIMKVGFNLRVRFLGHFPAEKGRELRIRVRAIDRQSDYFVGRLKREALSPPRDPRAAVRAIEFETIRADGPTLVIQFERSVAYQVAQGADFQSIIIAVSGPQPSKTCKPDFPVGRVGGPWQTSVVPGHVASSTEETGAARLPSSRRPSRKISKAELRSAGAAMDEARAALKRKKTGEAIKLLNKVLRYPEHEYSAEAQELLGLAYQRDGKLARARAEYKDLLARYNNSDDQSRVRQRLAAIEPASTDKTSRRRPFESKSRRRKRDRRGWSITGSASQFFVYDDSYRKLRDPSLPPDFNRDEDEHRVYQNALISTFYLAGKWENEWLKGKFQFSGIEEHSFQADEDERDIVGISSLYADLALKRWQIGTRVGRQTRNSGGVLGRFDGAVVDWQATPFAKLNIVGGAPVYSRKDEPFKEDSYFYGASVDFGPFFGGFDATVFAIEQRSYDFLDRRAIGFEARYFDQSKSLFATTDYDIYFNQLNLAILNGSWTFLDKSTLTAAFDYRTSPYLLTYNALQGQFVGSLDELNRQFSRKEIEQLARDRTATARSASIGYTRPLNSQLQIGIDATVANVSGTKASGNVPATESTGNEYYYALQLIGNGWFSEQDTTIVGLRYVDRKAIDTYVLDLNTRFLLTKDLHFNPRLRFSYQKSDVLNFEEYAIQPSAVFNYYITKDWSIELELGTKWSERKQGAAIDEETEYIFSLGYRYDFYAEHRDDR